MLSQVRSANLFVAVTVMVAFAHPAAAFDFGNSADKRAYCQVYARQAVNDARAVAARGCGFSGASWSGDVDDHFKWCMAQTYVGVPTQENLTRSTAIEQCSGGQNAFPPVVADTPAETTTPFPPVVADAPAEQQSTFPPVVADTSAPAAREEPGTQSASLPPVVGRSSSRSSRTARTSNVSFPPVVDVPDADTTADRREEIRAAVERLIEFKREHGDEIREVAHEMKEKIKRKLSDINEHHGKGDDETAGTLEKKIKEKISNLKEHHHGKHSGQAAGSLKENIKRNLSEFKKHHNEHHGQAERSLRSRAKNALKDGLMRRLASH